MSSKVTSNGPTNLSARLESIDTLSPRQDLPSPSSTPSPSPSLFLASHRPSVSASTPAPAVLPSGGEMNGIEPEARSPEGSVHDSDPTDEAFLSLIGEMDEHFEESEDERSGGMDEDLDQVTGGVAKGKGRMSDSDMDELEEGEISEGGGEAAGTGGHALTSVSKAPPPTAAANGTTSSSTVRRVTQTIVLPDTPTTSSASSSPRSPNLGSAALSTSKTSPNSASSFFKTRRPSAFPFGTPQTAENDDVVLLNPPSTSKHRTPAPETLRQKGKAGANGLGARAPGAGGKDWKTLNQTALGNALGPHQTLKSRTPEEASTSAVQAAASSSAFAHSSAPRPAPLQLQGRAQSGTRITAPPPQPPTRPAPAAPPSTAAPTSSPSTTASHPDKVANILFEKVLRAVYDHLHNTDASDDDPSRHLVRHGFNALFPIHTDRHLSLSKAQRYVRSRDVLMRLLTPTGHQVGMVISWEKASVVVRDYVEGACASQSFESAKYPALAQEEKERLLGYDQEAEDRDRRKRDEDAKALEAMAAKTKSTTLTASAPPPSSLAMPAPAPTPPSVAKPPTPSTTPTMATAMPDAVAPGRSRTLDKLREYIQTQRDQAPGTALQQASAKAAAATATSLGETSAANSSPTRANAGRQQQHVAAPPTPLVRQNPQPNSNANAQQIMRPQSAEMADGEPITASTSTRPGLSATNAVNQLQTVASPVIVHHQPSQFQPQQRQQQQQRRAPQAQQQQPPAPTNGMHDIRQSAADEDAINRLVSQFAHLSNVHTSHIQAGMHEDAAHTKSRMQQIGEQIRLLKIEQQNRRQAQAEAANAAAEQARILEKLVQDRDEAVKRAQAIEAQIQAAKSGVSPSSAANSPNLEMKATPPLRPTSQGPPQSQPHSRRASAHLHHPHNPPPSAQNTVVTAGMPTSSVSRVAWSAFSFEMTPHERTTFAISAVLACVQESGMQAFAELLKFPDFRAAFNQHQQQQQAMVANPQLARGYPQSGHPQRQGAFNQSSLQQQQEAARQFQAQQLAQHRHQPVQYVQQYPAGFGLPAQQAFGLGLQHTNFMPAQGGMVQPGNHSSANHPAMAAQAAGATITEASPPPPPQKPPMGNSYAAGMKRPADQMNGTAAGEGPRKR